MLHELIKGLNILKNMFETLEDTTYTKVQIEKDTFLSLSNSVVFLSKNLTETREWKKLSSNAKEIYRTLLVDYNYETGSSQITHAQILNEAGIGSNATIVKSLDILEEKGFIIRVESSVKSHCYLMPYQEKLYASLIKVQIRDLLSNYKVVNRNKKQEEIKKPHKLFFKACYNLISLGIESPDRLIDKHSSNGNILRIILSMCDSIYIAKKHKLGSPDLNLIEYLKDSLKNDNISENMFDDETMIKIKSIIKQNKQNITE